MADDYYRTYYPGYNPMDFDHDPEYGKGVSNGVLKINGQEPHELIQQGWLTKEKMQPEYKECIYSEVVRGLVTEKNLLSKEIELILDDKDLLTKLIYDVYIRAKDEMSIEYKGNSYIVTNHVYNFLCIISILIARDYDVYSLNFKDKELNEEIDIMKLMAKFKEQTVSNRAKNIADPNWKKGGVDTRFVIKETSPYLYTSEMIRNLYINHPNPQRFQEEYNEYLASKKEGDFIVSFEESMRYKYGLVLPKDIQSLQQFMEVRKKQMQEDQFVRDFQLSQLNNEIIEKKGGPKL